MSNGFSNVQLPKLRTRVRFSSRALGLNRGDSWRIIGRGHLGRVYALLVSASLSKRPAEQRTGHITPLDTPATARPTFAVRSDSLRDHGDGAAGTLLHADPTSLAEVEVELVALASSEFDDCVIRTDPKAVVALEAVAT